MKSKHRSIIIGDVHGCIDEFNELLEALEIDSTDTICSIGDLIDRGPDSAAVLKRCVKLAQTCRFNLVLGNHEEKFLRYLHHLKNKTGLETQMQGVAEFPELLLKIGEKEIKLIESAYYSLAMKEKNIMLVHGGISNVEKHPFPETYSYSDHTLKQFKGLELLTKYRYVNPEGKFVSLNQETELDHYWADVYDGRFGHIYFGHQPFNQNQPKEFPHATCLDTGCVFGGWLSAVILDGNNKTYYSVKAQNTYALPNKY
jgi:hypothetical protein